MDKDTNTNSGSSATPTSGGTYINVTSNDEKGHVNIYDNNPKEEHNSIHINIDYETGNGSITDTTNGGKETTDTKCYLTTACMRHFQESFVDSGYELTVLRWFRDNFVSQEDIAHYYETAPVIVSAINNAPGSDMVYDYIYENVVHACVDAIERGDYEFAYSRYKNSILSFEEKFAKPALQRRLIKALTLNKAMSF